MDANPGFSRRSFLQAGALAGGGAALGAYAQGGAQGAVAATDTVESPGPDARIANASIAQLQRLMNAGRLSSRELVDIYLARIRAIDRGLDLSSVLELNPDARAIAAGLDRERRAGGPRGPLHGIPILLKDNIDTADRMGTRAGSLALAGRPAPQDATVARRLRDAGAVIIGKANLSEWANFRGFGSSSGWSGYGGQCRNPYVLDRNPCGSSSGSAAAVSAALASVSLGTETDGSIVCPSGQSGVAGIKPTVGLTSRAGVVPISATQDTVGPHGRTVADCAAVLGALTGVDPRDPATSASQGNFHRDYSRFVDPHGLAGANIGVARQLLGVTTEIDAAFEAAVEIMRAAGANLVDVEIPSFDEYNASQAEIIVLIFEFKRDLNAYLATRRGVPARTLAEVIQFNLDHAEQELQFFGQELMELAEAGIFDEATYQQALLDARRQGGADGIDATLANFGVQAIVAPTNSPAWPTDLVNGDAFLFGSSGFAAVAGYPLVSVPAGEAFGLPIGITFMASAWSEPTLIKLASGFESAAAARRRPRFRRTLDLGDAAREAASLAATRSAKASTAAERGQRLARSRSTLLAPRLWRPAGL
ncbi:MAG TPA: amidase [Steroidobacteraceae bacterium]|nr:amidase [Steroidobacteraceae bacterium]